MLENQNTILNNMFIQNQALAAIRDRQLLMNSQFSQPMIIGLFETLICAIAEDKVCGSCIVSS